MDFTEGWIILDSLTYISCHMYPHGRKFLCIAYEFCTRARGDLKGTGGGFPISVNDGSDGKRERGRRGNGDEPWEAPQPRPLQ